MSGDDPILIVGAGPAGVAAACGLAVAGRKVLVCDSAPSPGGVIFRGVGSGGVPVRSGHLKKWNKLRRELDRLSGSIDMRCSTTFVGLDGDNVAILDNGSKCEAIRPGAIVLATGAVETVRPVPGWHHPGVITAGALQVGIKASGKPPAGDVLLAGNGPLLLAVAAQLAALGRAPAAVIDSGDPMAPGLSHFGLPSAYMTEGLDYLRAMRRHGIPWYRASEVTYIDDLDGRLTVSVDGPKGSRRLTVDIVALHNGLQSNSSGMPGQNTDIDSGPVVVRAGDCATPLGVRAAFAGGAHVATSLLKTLQGSRPAGRSLQLSRERRAQQRLARIYAPINETAIRDLPDETMLCRCERKRIGDLRRLPGAPGIAAREAKLNGRFGMGQCQGRFCARWTLEWLGQESPDPGATDAITGRRWPVRPVNLGRLASLKLPD